MQPAPRHSETQSFFERLSKERAVHFCREDPFVAFCQHEIRHLIETAQISLPQHTVHLRLPLVEIGAHNDNPSVIRQNADHTYATLQLRYRGRTAHVLSIKGVSSTVPVAIDIHVSLFLLWSDRTTSISRRNALMRRRFVQRRTLPTEGSDTTPTAEGVRLDTSIDLDVTASCP